MGYDYAPIICPGCKKPVSLELEDRQNVKMIGNDLYHVPCYLENQKELDFVEYSYRCPDGAEIIKLRDKLTFNQKENLKRFTNALDDMCPIKGCPDIWRIHAQAWFLNEGYELEQCAHKTIESLLGWAGDVLCKFMEVMNNGNNPNNN
jgi:hypothetical protein